ncbi:MAG: hypothetical protein R3B60_05180 [Candidatus Paceibacterota bacterium]
MTHKTYNNTRSMLIVGSIATLGILALANPAAAWYGGYGYNQSNDIEVNNHNSATVMNEVQVTSNTGYNAAFGGNTGRGGEGGDATGRTATGGDGGNSGSAGDGGTITTGDAASIGTVNNDVNRNNTNVTADCGCKGDITVRNHNRSMVGNALLVDSNTGDNALAGGTSGAAGNGGDATSHSWSLWKSYMNGGSATGGDGGNSGSAGDGGTITTGDAYSDGLVVNVVNRNVTRVAR